MMELRPYQQDLVDHVIEQRVRSSLIVLPTGAGKTLVAAEIVRRSENKHVLFVAHRRELIHQARDKLAGFGVIAGTILAGEPRNHLRGVQVGSIQTITRRGERPPANILFIDEAHHVPARTYRALIDSYPDAQIIGLTATPCRRDGRGLGSYFQEMVEGPQILDLVRQKYLVGTKVFAPSRPDLTGVRTRHGDYVEADLAPRMDRAELVGDIVSHWCRLANRRKTVLFCTNVAHSIHLCDEFVKAGVKAMHIDGSTPKAERDEILHMLAAGNIEVVVNCMVLTEGYDLPDLGCIVLARPTKSMGLFRQMVGRGLRPADGKDHCLVLDHAGAVFTHGFVEDPMAWALDPDTKAEAPAQVARNLTPSSRLLECSQCKAIRTAGEPCPHCGHRPKRAGEYLRVIDGDLKHVNRAGKQSPNDYSEERRIEFYRGALHIAIERGQKIGAAAHRYRERFGQFPPFAWKDLGPLPPTAEVVSWDRYCRIKWAKSVQKRAGNG